MEQSVYMELQRKLSNFYIKRVQPNLIRYNEIRKIKSKRQFIGYCIVFSLLGSFILSGVPVLNLLLMAIFFISLFVLIYVTRNDKNGEYETGLEYEVKTELMSDFVKLFGNLNWYSGTVFTTKKIGTAGELYPQVCGSSKMKNRVLYESNFNPMYFKNAEKVKALNLFNMAALTIDDCINGTYQNVPFSIIEAKTLSWMRLLSPLFILGFSFFWVILIVIFFFTLLACLMLMDKYMNIINLLIQYGIPKIASVIITATVFVVAIVLLIKLIIKFIKPFTGCFRGVIVEFAMNKNFEGQTIILDNLRDGRNVKVDKNKYSEVKLEDIEFMKDYTVYSDNQIEARYLITTAFIERLKNIETKFKSKYLRVAFKDNKIVIAVHTGRDMFKMADMFKETGQETFVTLFEEIASVLDFIDQLKLNSKLGL